MNKAAIKNFAVWARNKLIADITYKAGLLGISDKEIKLALPQSTKDVQFFDIGTRDPYSISGAEIKQREKLAETIKKKAVQSDYATAYKAVIEEVAYTWFNRLIAVRFMEVNDYLPSRIRVLSSESATKTEPDLVTTPFETDLEFTPYERDRIVQLTHDTKLDELFRLLFIKQCNALNAILPNLFEKTGDYTELLLNIAFTDQDGVVYHLVHDIDEDEFNIEKGGQVEIIGWLYQYYNTEPKDEAFALLKKNVKITKERIPAATQLFTPDWIVRYMVENSLGRLWLEDHPNDALKSGWKYYLDEAKQEADVQAQLEKIREEYKTARPEDIKVIDPCMGSGHILVYAFDVLMQIYEAAGYSQRDAAKSILENNIYGLDIDDRAFQLAYFAVMMKARQYNRRIMNGETVCHVYSIQESNFVNRTQLKYFGACLSDIEKNDAMNQITGLLDTFVDAKEYGSILNVEPCNWDLLHRFASETIEGGQMSLDSIGIDNTKEKLQLLIDIGQAMARKYDVVVTNPPYMGLSNGDGKLNDYVKKHYPDSKADLFAVFIECCKRMLDKNSFQAMITQHSWMFLSSYEILREKLQKIDIINMAHLGARAFEEIGGEVVQTTSFIIRESHLSDYKGTYCRLIAPTTQGGKEKMFLKGENRFITTQKNFSKIPGIPVAYWASAPLIDAFSNGILLGNIATPKQGIATTDNNRFVRLWSEVAFDRISFGNKSPEMAEVTGAKWFPMNKGGEFNKWYGNRSHVVNYEKDGVEIKQNVLRKYPYLKTPDFVVKNSAFYFRKCISWSKISMSRICFRYFEDGFIFSDAGMAMFVQENQMFSLFGLLNSKITFAVLQTIAPTTNFEAGHMGKIPIVAKVFETPSISEQVKKCIFISQEDWNAFEGSWEFIRHPLLRTASTVAEAYSSWESECNNRFDSMKASEEELNRIFIEIYGLQDELTPEVDDKDVTVRKADLGCDIRSLISYAVGCMFGRYSLDIPGLAYAGGEWDDSKYSSFIPDKDNILPITDEEYFEDDIVGLFCAWLKKVYGADTLEENLDFIAKALGNKGNTSREVIRNYFLNDFFKDHCATYSVTGSGKRPIYWLFDSGKQNGFKALIYLHRYDENTIGNLRIDYLHRMQRVYDSEIARMQETIGNSANAREITAAEKRKEKLLKQLKETKEYDEKIAHLALARIPIDLDDGVKVNYQKLQTDTDGKKLEVLAKI